MKTLYLKQGNKVICNCPNCLKFKVVDATKLMNHKGPVKIKYKFSCEACSKKAGDKNIVAMVERRRFYRKKMNITGQLMNKEGDTYQVSIANLSRTGIRVSVNSQYGFRPDDTLTVNFELDDVRKSRIQKEIVVRRTWKNAIDAEFVVSQSYSAVDKAIGFYLMN